MLFSDDSDDCNRLTKRLCIKSSHEMLVFATIFVSVKGVSYAIRVRELCSWMPTFIGEDSHSDDEDSMELHDQNKEELLDNNDAESVVGDDLEQVLNHLDDAHSPKNSVQKQDNGNEDFQDYREMDDKPKDIPKDSDPFGLESLIMKNRGKVWSNSHFDFSSASARGKSGGIIYIWNSSIFQKSSIQCNENYVVVDGLWTPKDVRIMWIVVYAPQNLFSKIALWSSLANIIANCNGILGSKMSKLDRFLVSDNFLDVFPFATGVILEKEMDGFHNLVIDTWNNDGIIENNGLISFKKKLQNIKLVIREWAASKILKSHKLKKEHQSPLSDIDVKTDNSYASDEDFLNRRESIKILGDINRREASDFAQKSRIKWALEGDKNSSFFHGSVKRKRRQLAITGILKNGDWIEDPNIVKFEFFLHFHSRFLPLNGHSTSLNIELPNHLITAQCDFLEHQCTREEIKKVVWDCGGDRASGPNGFTFNLITSFWDLLEADVVQFVYDLFLLGTFPKGCNSSFISFIPKIHGCLNNACFSVLVNGYPTFEFELFKGLRQGDPLSPLLFILMMEGLHAITCKSVNLGLFRGVSIGHDSLSISHLMYADDVIFLGEWSQSNIQKLLCMLRCFFLVLGLKINVQKSNISGVSVPAKDVAKMAKIL
ncbi:RNA-directed DNA polymerase, eukaryota, partial [Tanacetum coccineum]